MQKYIDQFLFWKADHSPSSIYQYKLWLGRFSEYIQLPLKDLEDTDVVRFHQWLCKEFRKENGELLSPKSIWYGMTLVKSFLSYWYPKGIGKADPKNIRIKSVRAKHHRPLQDSEFELIVNKIPLNNFIGLRNALIHYLLWDTAIRVSELTDLLVTDMDTVRQEAIMDNKKNGKRREIYWSKRANDVLLKYLPMRLEIKDNPYLLVGFHTDGVPTRHLTTRTVELIVEEYSVSALGFRVSPHCFRHGWTHKRRDLGWPLAAVQQGLGHTSPASTINTYEHYTQREYREIARKAVN